MPCRAAAATNESQLRMYEAMTDEDLLHAADEQEAQAPTWRETGATSKLTSEMEFLFQDLDGNPIEGRDAELEAFAVALAGVADEVKAQKITLLNVMESCSWCSYMVIVSVFSRPQLGAVIKRISDKALEDFQREPLVDSKPGRSEWEVLDYGDVVVHIMSPRQREFYDLESFYDEAEEIPLPFATEASPAA